MSTIELTKSTLYVTGLPRSGSTLLCQLLGMHPDIYSIGHSSPLLSILQKLRHQLSDNEFLLSQLDNDFDLTYRRLINVNRSIMNGWFAETDKSYVVDKNRGWLMNIDMVNRLDPNFRMLVCVREPAQIYGSIEAQHQKTLLLDFPDHLASLSPHARADKLFSSEGVIGSPLKSIEALQDVPDEWQQRLFYVVFEHLIQEPQAVMQALYEWLNIAPSSINPEQLPVKPHESDSHYRFKYLHQTRAKISPSNRHSIPPRIEAEIKKQFHDFYRLLYPGLA